MHVHVHVSCDMILVYKKRDGTQCNGLSTEMLKRLSESVCCPCETPRHQQAQKLGMTRIMMDVPQGSKKLKHLVQQNYKRHANKEVEKDNMQRMVKWIT